MQPNSVRDKEEVVVGARTFLVSSSPSTSPPPGPSEPELGSGVRERRMRKSINYAEPKLNTCVHTSCSLSQIVNFGNSVHTPL